ncbi:hypothetical protein AB1Y20_011972 [Prymnesium parvum]|uniref:Uncharacterized protein n=1 Tax=Prymnesium parvum TaxID=97485 RepID=A0AB34IQF5_PRYPA
MLAEMKAVNEQANRLIADHLEAYLRRNGAEATYEGWIGVLHPENCTLDERLLLPESEHLRLWRERGGARASEGERDGFWKAVATLAKNVTGERGGGRGRSGGGGGGAARGGRGGEPGGGAAPRPLVWSPLVEMGGEARDAPLDAADVATLEEAREEIKRLRGLLAQASDARAGKAAAPRAHAEEPPKTRLDALLSLTRFHSAAEAEAVQQHSEAKPPRASISKPLNVPSVDECFGHLFAPMQPPATTGSSAGSLRPGPPGGNPFDAVVAQPASPPQPAAPRAPVSASSTPLNPFGESSPAVSKPNPRSGSAHNPFD